MPAFPRELAQFLSTTRRSPGTRLPRAGFLLSARQPVCALWSEFIDHAIEPERAIDVSGRKPTNVAALLSGFPGSPPGFSDLPVQCLLQSCDQLFTRGADKHCQRRFAGGFAGAFGGGFGAAFGAAAFRA